MAILRDLTGLPYHYWTVLERAHNDTHGQAQWFCQCKCGTQRVVNGVNLRNGVSRSCGCYSREQASKIMRTHGMTNTAEYEIWCGMRKRCLNPKFRRFVDYGGRGITICPAWLASFEAFFADMGPRPSPRHSIERRNNDLGYSPENCVWATPQTQGRNTRVNHLLTYDNKTQCLQAWAEEMHKPRGTILTRLRLGWSVEKALTTPVRPLHRRKQS